MGGRNDSTNYVSPEICGITSIGFDHTDRLGTTINEIAAHKGGIIKSRIPVVVGVDAPHSVFKSIADSKDAPYIIAEHQGTSFVVQNEAIAK